VNAAVTLRPLGAEHLPALRPMLADPETIRGTRFPQTLTDDFLDDWLKGYEDGAADGSRRGFVGLDEGGEPVGLALAVGIDREAAEAELGYIVAPWARGRGIGTALLSALTRWAIDEQGIERVTLVIMTANAASERVAQRAGYTREGVMRSVWMKPGVRADSSLWSRLAGDGGE
jgi:RimJ/RimL family protein N-acetyltransferase